MPKGMNLRGSFYLETTVLPTACEPQFSSIGEPFVFVHLDATLSLWAHDPSMFRRLAEELVLAADRLEDAVLKGAAVRDV